MRENRKRSIGVILDIEGGFQAEDSDPGNWTGGKVGEGILVGTNFGISAASYPDLRIRLLTPELATAIYVKDYWNPINGDDLPSGVDLAVLNEAVHSGPVTAIKNLQYCVGAKQDGLIGPKTMLGICDTSVDLLISSVMARYMERLARLPHAGENPGWFSRAFRVDREAQQMAWRFIERRPSDGVAHGPDPLQMENEKLREALDEERRRHERMLGMLRSVRGALDTALAHVDIPTPAGVS